jgi:glycosyltransferase involved in cell wall biosynthesis
MDKVKDSILAPGIIESRVIPNAVSTDIFCPGDKRAARSATNLPTDATILCFAANSARSNPWKNFGLLRSAIASAAATMPKKKLLFLAIGETAPAEQLTSTASIRFIPYQSTPADLAAYYQAADIYIHAARAEVWGLTITEAMACGCPALATAVGGIPEQIEHNSTGWLVDGTDPEAMAQQICTVLQDPSALRVIGARAAETVVRRFSLSNQVEAYLSAYNEATQSFRKTSLDEKKTS